jgi:spore coat polysaccharide biosynthesis protein SpsF
LIDPKVTDETIALHLMDHADYTTNRLKPTFPDGLDVDVMSFESLARVRQKASKKSEREHVVPYYWNHPEEFVMRELQSPFDLSHHRWVLDQKEDYEMIQKIYAALYPRNPHFGMDDVLQVIAQNPDWLRVNSHIQRDEGYLKSLKGDKA